MTPERDRRLLRGSPFVLVTLAAAALAGSTASAPVSGTAAAAADAADLRAPGRLDDGVQSIRFDPVGFRSPAAAPVVLPAQPAVTTTALPGTAAARAIEFALAQRGLPYVWGGNGPQNGDDGFDCSGLTTAAYAHAGIALPRTAHTQYHRGPHVPPGAALLPGDLVFYGVPERVHHVGLYLGDGMMVNAPRRGKPVQIARVRYPGDDYLGATRPAAGIDAPAEGLLTTPQLPVTVPPEPSPTAPPGPEEFPAPAVPEEELVRLQAAPPPPAPDAGAPLAAGPDAPAPDAPAQGPTGPDPQVQDPPVQDPLVLGPTLQDVVPPPTTTPPPTTPPPVTGPGTAPAGPGPTTQPPTDRPTTPPAPPTETTPPAPAPPPPATTPPPATSPPPTTPPASTPPPSTTTPPVTTPPPTTTEPPPTTTPPPPPVEPEPTADAATAVSRPETLGLPGGALALAAAERGADGLPVAPSSPGAGGLRFSPAEGAAPARAVVALHPDAATPADGATITWRGAGEPLTLTVRSVATVPTADAAAAAKARGEGTRLVLVRTDPASGQTLLVIAE